MSGPSRRPLPAGPAVPARTGAFERLRALPDHRVVDRLLRGRACIWVIGIMLGGIVAMQVSLLRLNSGISRAVQTQSTLVRQNSALEAQITELTSGERVRAKAAGDSMVDPPAGDTRYLRARPAADPLHAVRRMRPPSDRARAIMANGGMLPGALAAAAPGTLVAPAAGAAATTAAPAAPAVAAAATPVPAAIAQAAPTGQAAPGGSATPVPTVAPTATAPVQTAPVAGAAAAPAGQG